MKHFTYYLMVCALMGSLHLVGMNIADIISHDADNEPDKMDIEFLTHPQRTTQFKNRRPVTLLQRNTMKVAPEALPVPNQPITIAEVDLMVNALDRIEQDQMDQDRIEQDTQGLIPAEQKVKKRIPHTDVIEDLLEPVQRRDVPDNLAVFTSHKGSRHHIRCDRCSTEKPFFISGGTFTIAYDNFKRHLKKMHKLSQKKLLVEAPRRKTSQPF